ncbi:glycosyl hydrolase family 16 [uncultured Algibacter sp.]|uniref:glycosyl hydrolase family 16 n=1 Tax=uncultured Algibacter sp. TaxID=298659 RepID=UPI0030EB51A0|tara:strand:- start:1233 stop:2642 length:1410 start_codon:yes stop_codon:yes gene_type:complete
MKNIKNNYTKTLGLLSIVFITVLSCERDISDEAVPASFPSTSEVFLDGFSGGMQYQAFGDIFNFEVDNDVTYKGIASMRFAVPAEGETGSFAGGNFFTGGANPDGSTFYAGARDLSGFDALTFWAKSSMPAEIDEVGFGLNPDQGDVFRVSLKNLAVNTNWKKYYIPIPDASKVTAEQGLFYYFEGPENGIGYTFWIDELQFEKLGTIAHGQPLILNGNDETTTGFTTVEIPLTGVGASFNLPNGINQTIGLTPAYFTFSSSDDSVASVSDEGIATVNSAGTAIITASLGEFEAQGSLTIESAGGFLFAPTPTQNEADVISLFSNAYTNVPGYVNNLFWEPFQETLTADFTIAGDDIINYIEFNFVGNQLTNGLLDASEKSTFHFDVFIPGDVAGAQLKVGLRDFGADGAEGGGDDFEIPMIITSFTAGAWNSFDMPLGSANRANLGFIVWEDNGSTLNNLYIDNIYFY